jgi:hypothetical protein
MDFMYNNQLDAPFILSLLNYHTSTCFRRINSPSSGGRMYICGKCTRILLSWLSAGLGGVPFHPGLLTVNLAVYKYNHSLCSSLNVRDQVSHPYKITGKTIETNIGNCNHLHHMGIYILLKTFKKGILLSSVPISDWDRTCFSSNE